MLCSFSPNSTLVGAGKPLQITLTLRDELHARRTRYGQKTLFFIQKLEYQCCVEVVLRSDAHTSFIIERKFNAQAAGQECLAE
jgi:hypothetical protein